MRPTRYPRLGSAASGSLMAQITKVSRTSVNQVSRPSYKFKTQFIIKKCPGNVPWRNAESTHREKNPTSFPGRFSLALEVAKAPWGRGC